MTSSTVATIIGTWTSDIGGVLSAALPAILVIAGAVFGLFLLVRMGKRFIGGR